VQWKLVQLDERIRAIGLGKHERTGRRTPLRPSRIASCWPIRLNTGTMILEIK
jgi:hypothetical protein